MENTEVPILGFICHYGSNEANVDWEVSENDVISVNFMNSSTYWGMTCESISTNSGDPFVNLKVVDVVY